MDVSLLRFYYIINKYTVQKSIYIQYRYESILYIQYTYILYRSKCPLVVYTI
jgi:hypothetical protein